MTFEKQKIDVTDRIIGKFTGNQIELYMEGEPIGQIPQSENSPLNLKNGFEYHNSRFYQFADVTVQPDQKFVDCDEENGWC
ncbi:YusG family protein [Bacillus carboniphilus]|uniref:YusG family protein n=1 Tax=Bacillus carboniphilus TaxID=86663 RepID=A0ABY9JUI6_9BACI|nr:YusG family protein [Bacillus carboniphilus]WLR41341.1 YusG family protein [Bacillus carboniphilus]